MVLLDIIWIGDFVAVAVSEYAWYIHCEVFFKKLLQVFWFSSTLMVSVDSISEIEYNNIGDASLWSD